ncbi:porin, OprB family [Pseudoxanthomonas sp. GM95]|uniref:carbohydrate porin n=1 Tax=Pseudoxanthomonas sp. GM95 TaxID=1881043 RepID=UPI0008C8A74D|nr:carbohydrate porin [Pseudoxanthomonas sp. GM95]SEM53658.1 porin, OprB family [Pseudoxanthomonas sp. GM95]
MNTYRLLPTVLAAALLAMSGRAMAWDLETSPYLLGDWGGARADLENRGVKFQFNWVNEVAHNFSGGDRDLTRSAGQVVAGATVDLERFVGWSGWSTQVAYTQRLGRTVDQDAKLGTSMQVQEIYGRGQTLWLTQLSIEKTMFDGRFSLKMGRLPINGDFGYADCDFQNLSFCAPQAGNIDGGYWYSAPVGVWAARARWNTTARTYLQLGAYQDSPVYGDTRWARRSAWKIENPGSTAGALIPLEFGWTPNWNGLDGLYKIGAWVTTGGGNDLVRNQDHGLLATDGGVPMHHTNSYGGYIAFKQQVHQIAGGGSTTLFLNLTKSDHATSQTSGQLSMGVQVAGAFGRSNDVFGFAMAATQSSSYYAEYARLYNLEHGADTIVVGGGYEKTAEIHYAWSPIPSLSISPNIQYVVDPGGDSDHASVVVLGLRTIVNF